jgi:Ca-activated chloride channel family protein
VTFAAPLLLAGLALVPIVAVAYALAQRRRRRYAVRYTNVDLLATVAGRAWGRHVPALLALLALAALVVALARPQRTVAAERRQATVVLVTDTSGSMRATDIRPTRLAAAQAAARTFAQDVPDAFRLGLVRFSSVAEQLSEPTTDHARVLAAVNSLRAHGHTAIGDGLALALDSARAPVVDPLGGRTRLPAALVLLSDGANTRGQDPLTVAQRAKRFGVRVFTVALGTRTGVLIGRAGKRTPVPPDAPALQTIARDTGGQFFAAPDARRLQSIYAGLATRLSHTRERREVTSAFAGGALALLLAGAAVGLVRGGRLP